MRVHLSVRRLAIRNPCPHTREEEVRAAWVHADDAAAPQPRAPPAASRRQHGLGRPGARGRPGHTPRELRAPIRLHVGLGEEKFCFAPRSALWRREAHLRWTQRHGIGHRACFNQTAVDFYVHRSAEEQDGETPHPTGKSGLVAEEE